MRRQPRGQALIGLAVFVVIVIFGFGVCVAICSDDDDNDSAPALVASKHHKHDGGRERDRKQDRSTGKNSRGKCEGADYCDDRDFSPTFDKSPVQDSFNVCLPGATCHYDGRDEPGADQPPAGEGQAAFAPPSNLDPRCAPFHCDPQPTRR